MTTGSFPLDPHRRKVILVLSEHDLERCAYEPHAAQALLDEETYVLPFPPKTDESSPDPLQNIVAAGLARPGAVLVQSPYEPDSYVEVTLATQRFALEKHMYFSLLCNLLGAKEVKVEQVDLRTRNGKTSLNTEAGRKMIGADLAIESEELDRFRAALELHDQFAGGAPDLAAAEDLLRRTGLRSDISMSSLLDMRRNPNNSVISRKLTFSLSSEAKSNLHVVGRLKLPAFVTVSSDYTKVVKEDHEYTLTVVVRF